MPRTHQRSQYSSLPNRSTNQPPHPPKNTSPLLHQRSPEYHLTHSPPHRHHPSPLKPLTKLSGSGSYSQIPPPANSSAIHGPHHKHHATTTATFPALRIQRGIASRYPSFLSHILSARCAMMPTGCTAKKAQDLESGEVRPWMV